MSHMWDILHATRLHVSNFCAQVIVKVCANILSNWKSSNMYELELQLLTSIMMYSSKLRKMRYYNFLFKKQLLSLHKVLWIESMTLLQMAWKRFGARKMWSTCRERIWWDTINFITFWGSCFIKNEILSSYISTWLSHTLQL